MYQRFSRPDRYFARCGHLDAAVNEHTIDGAPPFMRGLRAVFVADTHVLRRTTRAELAAGARLVVRERLMTHGDQRAISTYVVNLNGKGSSADVVSRSVARDNSYQKFDAKLVGSAECSGHTECDSIIMDNGRILAVPGLEANDVDAALVHEAAIGKIAGDQLIKLMTLGLTEHEAEEQIINGFLK